MLNYQRIREEKFKVFQRKNLLLKQIVDKKPPMEKKDVEEYNKLTTIYKKLREILRDE